MANNTFSQQQLQRILTIAQAAGERIMAIYANEALWHVEEKADHSPIAAADRAAHDYIMQALQTLDDSRLSGVPVLSEESSEEDIAARSVWGYLDKAQESLRLLSKRLQCLRHLRQP